MDLLIGLPRHYAAEPVQADECWFEVSREFENPAEAGGNNREWTGTPTG